MTTPLEKQLAEALGRVMKWAGPIAGDNRDLIAAQEEDASAEQAKAALAEYNRQLSHPGAQY